MRLLTSICGLPSPLRFPRPFAIQNARLREQAEIFRTELEQRLADVEHADEVLGKERQSRELS